MVRRKRSLLFTTSLVSIGLVVGAIVVVAPKSQAANTDEYTMSVDALTNEISEVSDTFASDVQASLKTHELIADVKDPSALDKYEDIVKKDKLTDEVYILHFSTYEATANTYLLMKEDEQFNNIILNRVIDNSERISLDMSQDFWEKHQDCVQVMLNYASPTAYLGHTKIPIECKSWGVTTMKQDTFVQEHADSSNAITVAVLDTGIKADHDAFKYNTAKDRLLMSQSYDYADNDNDPNDDTQIGHGTTVAGTIVQSTPKNVKIVTARTMGAAHETNSFAKTLTAVADYSTGSKHVNVINMSTETTDTNQDGEEVPISTSDYTTYEKVFKRAKEANTIVVASAGNESRDWVGYPASSQYSIAVSSVREDNTFSSSFSNYSNDVDFSAPGEDLLLPGLGDYPYHGTDGTSFSAPFAAAMVANILTEHPNYTFDQVYNELKLNAEDLGAAGKDRYYGWGSLSFHVHKYADLNISTPTLSPAAGTWTNGSVSLSASATSDNYNINRYNTANSDTSSTTPSSWSTVNNPGKTYSITQSASSNGTYTFWAKNSNNETAVKTVKVSNIDKTDPTISTALSTSNISATDANLNIGVTDSASGLGKIVWHYKESDASDYTDKTDTYATSGTGATSATAKTTAITGLTKNKNYTAYATVYDMAGNHKDSATVTFTTTEAPSTNVPATSVTVSPVSISINVGETATIVASMEPSNTTDTLTWSSSNTEVATVSNTGKITALKAGTTTITARANANVASTVTVTVQGQAQPTDPTQPTDGSQPKPVKPSNDVKNPKTADVNVGSIASMGAFLSIAAYFVFRAKRRQ